MFVDPLDDGIPGAYVSDNEADPVPRTNIDTSSIGSWLTLLDDAVDRIRQDLPDSRGIPCTGILGGNLLHIEP